MLYDMLDVFPGRKAKFVKNYMHLAGTVQEAVALYVKEVKDGSFPGPEHLSRLVRDSHGVIHSVSSLRLVCSRRRTTSSCRPWAICTRATSS